MSEAIARPDPAAPTRGPRQVIRFTSLNDVFTTAQQLFAAGCTPRGVDRPEKLIPILLTGAELGLGIMQSIKHITPPVNGACNLWGDMGLALVRQSGELQQFEERIEGDGDDRKAVCVIQRRGYTVKTFEYTLKLAKALKSYQAAYRVDAKTGKQGGGPWLDDPDNMLMWRARWRAIRSEFTDVLNGLGGAEEQEAEQAITVEVVSVTHHAPTTTPADPPAPAALPAAPASAVPAETLAELSRLRAALARHLDSADTAASRWREYLTAQGVTSARDLSADAATAMVAHFGGIVDGPFDSPAISTPPPSGPTS
jgi:hypothetical protein